MPSTRCQTNVRPDLPNLQLLRQFAQGGHGELWLARAATGVLRAVKIVHRGKFEDSRPYEREFEGIRHFEPISREHSGLMDVLHVGRDPNDLFFYSVLELADPMDEQVSGSAEEVECYTPWTLHNELKKRQKLPIAQVIEHGCLLANALAFLHSRGLVHRDIKPSNIIFVKGEPKLADIGLVTLRDTTLSYVGTTGYVPLEGPGTEMADIYALGKLLYQSATGLSAEAYPELPSKAESWPDWGLFLELNHLIARACSPRSRSRYASASLFQKDLELLATGSSPRRRARLKRRALAASAITALAILWAGLKLLNPTNSTIVFRDDFDTELNAQTWREFHQNAHSQVVSHPGFLALESRGGIDFMQNLPSDFELLGRFRFMGMFDHLRVYWRTDLSSKDAFGERDGILVIINQNGEVTLGRRGEVFGIEPQFRSRPFARGADCNFRITSIGNRHCLYIEDFKEPLLTGYSEYSKGARLALSNREIPGTRVELDYLELRDLTKSSKANTSE